MATDHLNIVISGGLGGIGRAMASRFARDGHAVFVLDRKEAVEAATEFVSSFKDGNVRAYPCDITDASDAKKAIDEIVARAKSVDVCIHAAVSPLIRKRASMISPEEFRQQFDVTVFGGLNLFQAVIPYMKKQKSGLIIGFTTSALEPEAGESKMAGYASAKSALRGLLRELSFELKTDGIRVNAIAPSFVPTQLNGDLPLEVKQFIVERAPSTTPEAVADMVADVCSGGNKESTGMSYPVGGGKVSPL